MAKLVTAFLGVAHIHTPGFIHAVNKRKDEISVKYVYDRDAARGEKRAGELEGSAFTASPQAILEDPEVTSVVICSETSEHLELVSAAAKAGKHIFCEKPLGLGADDVRAMASAIKAAGVTFQTGFFMRGAPMHQWIKTVVASGALGKITRVRYTNCHQAALDGWFDTDWRWLADPKLAGGGALLDLGAHALDLIINTYTPTEGKIVGVAGALGNRVGRYGSEIDEYGTGLLTFESGATAVIEASWVDPSLRSPIEVFGTEGQIQLDNSGIRYFSKNVEGADGKQEVTGLPPGAPHAFELFWDSLLGKPLQVPLISVDEAAEGSIVMEKIYNAAGRSTTGG
jgi:predicted dehydrogenase